MRVLVGRQAPGQALRSLSRWAQVVPFWAPLLPHAALQGHADLFVAQVGDTLLMAPNAPAEALALPHLRGITPVGGAIASLGAYNVSVGNRLAIGHAGRMDAALRPALAGFHLVSVRQGMARCAALTLDDDAVITSDGGIAKALRSEGREVLWVSPLDIALPGYRHGCLGGCCGKHGGVVYLMGSLRRHRDGLAIAAFIRRHGMETEELCDGPMLDVGSLFFVP